MMALFPLTGAPTKGKLMPDKRVPPEAPTSPIIDALRRNRAGALLAGLVVMVAVALVLGAAVPPDLNTAIAVLVILLLATAVGFAVKVTSPKQDTPMVVTAGALAAIGVPLLFGAGGATSVSDGGRGFDQAMLAGIFDSYLSAGSALAAVVAIIVAAWGERAR
jgi:hypothetical protein